MTALTYAGIGARATPSSVRADITVIAGWLARTRVPTPAGISQAAAPREPIPHSRHCQTNLICPVEPTIEDAQAAS